MRAEQGQAEMNAGKTDQHAGKYTEWFGIPSHQNPKAAIPLYLASVGSLCWEQAALWSGGNHPVLFCLCIALVLAGLVLLPLGLIGGIIYRHYRVSQGSIIISLVSPPVWIWLFGKLHGFFGPDTPQGFIVALCFYLQLPLVLVALWRSPWQKRTKIAITSLMAVALICQYSSHVIREQHEAAMAPHISDNYLASIYRKHDISVTWRLNGKEIVVTGIVGGQDEGLFGGGPPKMRTADGEIECDDLGSFDGVGDGQKVSILCICIGKDAYGTIHLVDCRSVGE